MPNWNDYRFFVAVAETGSLSSASRRLRVSQPTVGRRIATLETQLGTRLFDRRPEGHHLTAAGERLLPAAREAKRHMEALEVRARGEDVAPEGVVRLSATEGLALHTLVPRLGELRRRAPGIAIELLLSFGVLDLLRGEADVVLRHTNPGSPDLVGRRVSAVTFGLYASRAYLAERGVPRRPEDLSRHDIIAPGRDLERIAASRWLARWARGRTAWRCNTLPGHQAMARAGLGIALLPRYLVRPEDDLRRVLAGAAQWSSDLWVLTHRDLARSPRVRAVTDFLAEVYRGARL